MMKRPSSPRMTALLPLLLFAVFASCICAVLLTGANGYQDLVRRDADSYTVRTAVQYVSMKIRQAESPDAVTVAEFGGQPALMLREETGGQELVTCIYCYDGWLREVFCFADSGMSPEDGVKLLAMNSLTAEERDGLLTLTLTGTSGSPRTLVLNLSAREGQLP